MLTTIDRIDCYLPRIGALTWMRLPWSKDRSRDGAHPLSPAAESPRQPDPYPGCRRARLSRQLPVLALLLGALSLSAVPPAQAQNQEDYPRLSGLSVGGRTLNLVASDGGIAHSHRFTVTLDTVSVTVTPTWTGHASVTATVSSEELQSGTVITQPTSVTSGGSVTVALASASAIQAANTGRWWSSS